MAHLRLPNPVVIQPHSRGEAVAQLSRSDVDRLLQAVPEAIAVISANGYIEHVNQRLCALFGYGRSGELLGRPVEDLIPERRRLEHVSRRSAYQREPRVCAMAAGTIPLGLRQDGTEFAIELNLAPIAVVEQPMTVAVVRDVSGSARRERELHHALEARSLRVRELDHRFRNHLQMLSSLLSLEAGDTEDRAGRILVELTRQRVGAVALAYRLASQVEPEGARVSLDAYVRAFAAPLIHAFCADGIESRLRVELRPRTVAMDHAIGAGLVLTQLVGTCMSQMFRRGRRSPVGARRIEVAIVDAGEAVELSVVDTGSGAAASTRSAGGLEAVRALVGSLRGTVAVGEKGGRGVVARLLLPSIETSGPDPG